MWRLPGWVRNPDRQEARIPPAGDQKPAADAKARGQGAWARAAECKAYPVCPANDANVVLGFTGNGCGAAPLGGSATGQRRDTLRGRDRRTARAARPRVQCGSGAQNRHGGRLTGAPYFADYYRTASAGRPPPPRCFGGGRQETVDGLGETQQGRKV